MELFICIILALLIFLGLMVLILFFTPIRYSIRGGYCETVFFTAFIRSKVFFQLNAVYEKMRLSLFITILGIPFAIHPEKRKKKGKGRGKEKKTAKPPLRIFADRAFVKNVLSLSKDVLQMVGPESLEISGRLGFEEPCYNGYISALSWYFKTNIPSGVKVDLQPVWEEEHIDLTVSLSGKALPGLLIYRFLSFFLARESRKAWRALRAEKRRLGQTES